MSYLFKIELNTRNDAWNWWNGCNSVSHGTNWKKRIDSKLVTHIHKKSQEEAFEFLLPFLKENYKKDRKFINQFRLNLISVFEKQFDQGCKNIERVMGKLLYRNSFTFYLTTFPRAPYYKEKGYIWIPIKCKDPMSIFLHELCHFQFIHYWRENPNSGVSELSENQFEYLKESLTMILDKDFLSIIKKPDEGYEIHEKFRKELTNFWQNNKNFDELVKFGIERIGSYIPA